MIFVLCSILFAVLSFISCETGYEGKMIYYILFSILDCLWYIAFKKCKKDNK